MRDSSPHLLSWVDPYLKDVNPKLESKAGTHPCMCTLIGTSVIPLSPYTENDPTAPGENGTSRQVVDGVVTCSQASGSLKE